MSLFNKMFYLKKLLFYFTIVISTHSVFAQEVVVNKDNPFETPRTALYSFINAARAGNYNSAAKALGETPQSVDREELARKLKFVLDNHIWIDYSTISNEPAGNPDSGISKEEFGKLIIDGRRYVFVLQRFRENDLRVWKVSQGTLQFIPELYEKIGHHFLASLFPESWSSRQIYDLYVWQIAVLPLLAVFAFLIGLFLNKVLFLVLTKVAHKTEIKWDDLLLEKTRRPVGFFLFLLIYVVFFKMIGLPVPFQIATGWIFTSSFILTVLFLLLRLTDFGSEILRQRLAGTENADSIRGRGVRTQIIVLRRIVKVLFTVVAIAMLFSQFDAVRRLGMSLLASAGVAGIVLGLAAQKSIASILSGIQLAITQPVRIGDTVIIENEYGIVEEINLTFIVVRIWDARRLVIPVTDFLSKPFQNWTRVSTELLGSAEIFVDYSAPVKVLEKKLLQLVAKHPLWDKRVANIQVTDCTETTMKLRCLVSAANAPELWDLRVAIRKDMIAFLQSYQNGKYLPKLRISK